jgi:hypothetical protein
MYMTFYYCGWRCLNNLTFSIWTPAYWATSYLCYKSSPCLWKCDRNSRHSFLENCLPRVMAIHDRQWWSETLMFWDFVSDTHKAMTAFLLVMFFFSAQIDITVPEVILWSFLLQFHWSVFSFLCNRGVTQVNWKVRDWKVIFSAKENLSILEIGTVAQSGVATFSNFEGAHWLSWFWLWRN